jgi:hypothetical protein
MALLVTTLFLFEGAAALSVATRLPVRKQPIAGTMADDAFEAAVRYCESKALQPSEGLSAEVPRLLRYVFDADFKRLVRESGKTRQNVTCMRPADGVNGFGLFDDALLNLQLHPGRVCQGGTCCDACSRVSYTEFATGVEAASFRLRASSLMPPTEEHLHHNMCAMFHLHH